MARPHIQVVLASDIVPESLRTALHQTNATAGFWPLAEALRADLSAAADAIVIVVPEDSSGLAGPLRVLFDRLAEHPRATLVLSDSGRQQPPLVHPPVVPVSYGHGLDQQDLSVRLTTMLEMRDSLDSLHRGMLATKRSGDTLARRYISQLRLASQVQREFLPETLPRFGPVSFSVLFRPVDFVSGDIYDVHRLDEDHVGIAIADASGHGIPAALLTVYIKRALRGKEIEHGTYRILSPDEVLNRLNEDILDAHLTECPFVAAVYAVLNTRTLEMSLARGGAPYPIHRTADGKLRLIDPPGGVVGVLAQPRFEVRQLQLQPGDSLLIFSDGLERIIAPLQATGDVPDTLRRAAERISRWSTTAAHDVARVARRNQQGDAVDLMSGDVAVATLPAEDEDLMPTPAGDVTAHSAWADVLRHAGTGAAIEQLADRQRALRRMGFPLDDLTVLAVQVEP